MEPFPLPSDHEKKKGPLGSKEQAETMEQRPAVRSTTTASSIADSLEKELKFESDNGSLYNLKTDTHPQVPERTLSRATRVTTNPIQNDDARASLDPTTPVQPAQISNTAQDWTGPDDPENPFNWSFAKRAYHTFVVAGICFVVSFGSSVYSPAAHEVAVRFDVSLTVALLPLSIYVLGLAFGPVLAAPISETLGRNIVYRVTLPVCMFFTIGAGFSQNIQSLIICRFLAGLFASPVLAVGGGTSADIWPRYLSGRSVSLFLVAPFLGPAFGPVIGGFVAQYKDWRWTQWCILFAAVPFWLLSLFMQETYKKIILKNRAKCLNLPPPTPTGPTGAAALKFLLMVTLVRPVHMLLTEPIVLFLSLYIAFVFSVLFAFFAAFPIVFQGVYGFDIAQYGLTFLAIAVGVLLATAGAILVDTLDYQKRYRRVLAAGKTNVTPEYRLYPAMYGSFAVTVGLFWFAWTSRVDVHWIVPVIGSVPFALGNLSIFTSSALYLMDTYGTLNGASALAANGLARYGLAAVFPLFTVQMYNNLGIQWATSLLAFLSLPMLPIPWVLFKWGPYIRGKSRYETTKF